MGVRPSERRIVKYTAKLQGEALSVVTGRQIDEMIKQVEVIFPEIENVENETKLILEDASEPIILNVSYLNFAREIYSAKKRFAGGQLLAKADTILTKWKNEGCDDEVLERIRDTIFTLEAPAP